MCVCVCVSHFGAGVGDYGPPRVDRIWGIWGPPYNVQKAIFYLLKGDYYGLGGVGSGQSGGFPQTHRS